LMAVGLLKPEKTLQKKANHVENEDTARLLRKGQLGKLKKTLSLKIESVSWERGLAPDKMEKRTADDSIVTLEKNLLETSSQTEVKNLLMKLKFFVCWEKNVFKIICQLGSTHSCSTCNSQNPYWTFTRLHLYSCGKIQAIFKYEVVPRFSGLVKISHI